MEQIRKQDQVFQKEEMIKVVIPEEWGPDDAEKLMKLRGIALLKDVVRILQIHTMKITKRYQQLECAKIGSGYRIMGAKKVFSQWIVCLSIFLPYYREHLQNRMRKVQPSWDGNQLLAQRGRFFLVDVCKKLPLTAYQLRYRAKINPHSQSEYGLWKDPSLGRFIVDMEIFAAWVKALHGSMSHQPSTTLTSPKRQRITKSMAALFPLRSEVFP